VIPEKYMSLRLSKIFVLVSFFPIWIFRSELHFIEILISILVFLVPPYLIFIYFFNENNYQNKRKLFLLFLSIIIFYGIDNHLGLKSGLIGWNADLGTFLIRGSIVIPASILIIFGIINLNLKFINVFFIFIITITVFNLFDQTKSSKKILNFEKQNKYKPKETVVILILDEMSGFNSIESETIEGKKFNNFSKKILAQFNFNIFENAETASAGTIVSIPNALNFLNSAEGQNGVFFVDDSNYFQNHIITQNLLFDKFKSISVFQNMYINYCLNRAVYKCDTFNPFKQEKFIEGYKDNIFSKIFSINQLNGSIMGFIYGQIFQVIRLIDLVVEPMGEKITFQNTLNKITTDIHSEKYDLIFAHVIVPHKPYGYNDKCQYDGNLSFFSSRMNNEQKIKQHNIERICVFKFLNTMIEDIYDKNKLNHLKFILMSDHGSKIQGTNHFSSILAYRDKYTQYEIINDKITVQSFLKNKFDN
tara:strand:- start:144 stop:1571 length:1428 start_codon:yes stop_codon:yes gene_type:complete